jgi:hypothetical protein
VKHIDLPSVGKLKKAVKLVELLGKYITPFKIRYYGRKGQRRLSLSLRMWN